MKKRPRPEIGVPYSPATREVERVLCQILEEYLGLDRVGIDDNYAELGATSRPEIGVPNSTATREVERVHCQILQEYLRLDRVRIDDNHAELRATSLDMVQLSGQMARHYPQVSVVSQYNHATVRQLATFSQPPQDETNAPSPQPAVQTNTRANQIAKRALQIAKNTARSHTSLH